MNKLKASTHGENNLPSSLKRKNQQSQIVNFPEVFNFSDSYYLWDSETFSCTQFIK